MEYHITLRYMAQQNVRSFNRMYPVKSKVTYLKSEIEGRLITSVEKPAYILGDDVAVVDLAGIGVALLEKVEPYTAMERKHSLFDHFRNGLIFMLGGKFR